LKDFFQKKFSQKRGFEKVFSHNYCKGCFGFLLVFKGFLADWCMFNSQNTFSQRLNFVFVLSGTYSHICIVISDKEEEQRI
jgi:hypothetical protein